VAAAEALKVPYLWMAAHLEGFSEHQIAREEPTSLAARHRKLRLQRQSVQWKLI
jgi:hypothetical protein